MKDNGCVIIGAGLAGLSAAWRLQGRGRACDVYEKEPEVGGLCRSRRAGGFTFDIDGHLLHFKNKGSFAFVSGLLQRNLVKHRRRAWVYALGRFIEYPFQANLAALPADVREECLAGFLKARQGRRVQKNGDFLRWIRGTFGEGIARHFMVPYNTKFWTVPPEELTCGWLEGFVPQPTVSQVTGRPVRGRQGFSGYNAHFWYPRTGGIETLAHAFQSRLSNIHTGFKVVRIDLMRRQVEFANGVKKDYTQLISTIPLPELSGILSSVPKRVRAAFGRLRWNSVFNLNIGLKQSKPSDKHWIYFSQKDISFFRVGFYHNFSADLVPPGKSSLYAEVSYSRQKPINKAGMARRIERDLRKVGLLSEDDEILVRDSNDIKYAYPLYDKNYEAAREEIFRFLQGYQVVPCGRYGSWRYMSMEDVILDGIRAGDLLGDDHGSGRERRR